MSEKTRGTCYFGILPAHMHLQLYYIINLSTENISHLENHQHDWH